jgi:alpha-beta hydrolase superfamily lysophospholipase
MILRPDRGNNSLYELNQILDVDREEYFVESHGSKLHAWMFRKPNSRTLVIVHHGNAGNILNRLFLAKAFLRAGTSVLLYDYRGYGKSTGPASLSGLDEDGIAAFDFAKTAFNYPVMINYGESIGSNVACTVDRQRPANALILQSGITSVPNVAQDGMILLRLYPDWLWPQPRFDNRILLAQSKTPLLVLHGQRDTMVPCSESQYLFDCAAATDKSFIKLPNCGHNNVGYYDQELFQKSITDFVGAHMGAGTQTRLP